TAHGTKKLRTERNGRDALRAFRQGQRFATASLVVHGRARLSKRKAVARADQRRRPLATRQDCRTVEGQGPRSWTLELVLAAWRARRRPDESGICPLVRDHGTLADGARGVQ